MPIRNPFARRPGAAIATVDENLRPDANTPPAFERVDTVGSKASSVLTIRSTRSQDTGEYKMSGEPPSPPPRPPGTAPDQGRLSAVHCHEDHLLEPLFSNSAVIPGRADFTFRV
jgi:hypothetical protein